MMLFILQKTAKSIQRHLHEFCADLAQDSAAHAVTPGACTQARAKLRSSAFVELNQQIVLPLVYGAGSTVPVSRWRGHRLLGADSSLVRLPHTDDMIAQFGLVEGSNQHGATGTNYPEGRLSVICDLLNRIGLDARLEPSAMGEVDLAIDQLAQVQPGDVVINDRGFTGYRYLAQVRQHGAHFIARCSTGSFAAAQELFRLQRAGRSGVVKLFAPAEQKAELRRRGLPLEMVGRFVSVRLPTGELEVLATSLLEEADYPTAEFLEIYHRRWGHETYHLLLKSRLDLENWSGQTPEAVRQDVQASVFLGNVESVLSQPAQQALTERSQECLHRQQVNRAVSYHALKDRVLDVLYREGSVEEVMAQLQELFLGSPVSVRPGRKVPRRPLSLNRSYHFQRHVKKLVF